MSHGGRHPVMPSRLTVCAIEAKNADASLRQLLHLLFGFAGWPEGGDNLSARHGHNGCSRIISLQLRRALA
ncbi:hypothetical protein HRbin36_00665 [bacterium HR36]|nr:hypothetical protein HRbin36_00665 [bacterium HR36]